jgi:PST family polysaccharide transporter
VSDERVEIGDEARPPEAPRAYVEIPDGATVLAFPATHRVSDLDPEDEVAVGIAEDGPGIEPDLLDPEHEATVRHVHMPVAEVKRLAVRGIAVLAVRTFGLRMITFTGNVILARTLVPKSFGLFAIVSFIVQFAAFLADMGIGPALVQRKEELTEADLRTAFTLSFIIDAAFTIGLVLVAPWLVRIYHLEPRYVLPVRVLSVTIMMSTFATVPNILLERRLQFARNSAADMIASITYITLCVLLVVVAGFQLWSFIIASIVSRIVNTVLMNTYSFWRPRFGLARDSVRSLLRFGLPYQANGLLLQIKDSLVPTFVAWYAGAAAVGYLNWSIGMAANALFLLTIVTRVTFPAYARLQHDPRELRTALEQSIKWVAATVFPVALLLMAVAPQVLHYVYGEKWRPGLVPFYLLCIPIMMSSYSTVVVSALYGLGRARQVLKLTVIWTIVGWGLAIPLTLRFGITGFAGAMALVSSLSVMSVFEVNKVIKIHFVPTLLRIFCYAALPALAVWALAPHIVHDLVSLAFLGFAGGVAYLSLMYVGGELTEARQLMRTVMKRG